MKRILSVFLALTMIFSLTACGKSGDRSDTDPAEATNEADVKNMLAEVSEWLRAEIWYSGFQKVSRSIPDSSFYDETIDIDVILEQLAKAMEKKADYDTYMLALPADYFDLVSLYVEASNELDIQYVLVRDHSIDQIATASFYPLISALEAFIKACYEIVGTDVPSMIIY